MLRVSEERLRTVIGNLPGAVFRCLATPPYADEYVSDMIEMLTGYRAEEFMAGTVHLDHLILPDHLDRTDAQLAEAIATPAAVRDRVPDPPPRRLDPVALRARTGAVRRRRRSAAPRGVPLRHHRPRRGDRGDQRELSYGSRAWSRTSPERCSDASSTPPYRDLFVSDAIEDLTGYPRHRFSEDLHLYDLILDEHRGSVDAQRRRSRRSPTSRTSSSTRSSTETGPCGGSRSGARSSTTTTARPRGSTAR